MQIIRDRTSRLVGVMERPAILLSGWWPTPLSVALDQELKLPLHGFWADRSVRTHGISVPWDPSMFFSWRLEQKTPTRRKTQGARDFKLKDARVVVVGGHSKELARCPGCWDHA